MTHQLALGAKTPPAIATTGLSKRYQHHLVIKDLDLAIPPGSVLGILGVNGSGKSSLIKLLATIEAPTRGQIYFQGDRLVPGATQLRLRKTLGYLPEQEKLNPNLSVTAYLNYFASLYQIPPTKSKIRIFEALEWVSLAHKHQSLIGNLSQGEQKRLSLARAIIHEPTILLLDNPFTSLDEPSQLQLENLLSSLREAAMTVIVTATNLAKLITICTEIQLIEYGYLTDCIDLSRVDRNKLNLDTPNLEAIQTNNSDFQGAIAKFSSILENFGTNLDQDNRK